MASPFDFFYLLKPSSQPAVLFYTGVINIDQIIDFSLDPLFLSTPEIVARSNLETARQLGCKVSLKLSLVIAEPCQSRPALSFCHALSPFL